MVQLFFYWARKFGILCTPFVPFNMSSHAYITPFPSWLVNSATQIHLSLAFLIPSLSLPLSLSTYNYPFLSIIKLHTLLHHFNLWTSWHCTKEHQDSSSTPSSAATRRSPPFRNPSPHYSLPSTDHPHLLPPPQQSPGFAKHFWGASSRSRRSGTPNATLKTLFSTNQSGYSSSETTNR